MNNFKTTLEQLANTDGSLTKIIADIAYITSIPDTLESTSLDLRLNTNQKTYNLSIGDIKVDIGKRIILSVLDRQLKEKTELKDKLLGDLVNIHTNEKGKQ
jgi:hypothetical protein